MINSYTDDSTIFQPVFKLDAGKSSYVFGVNKSGLLLHFYYGAKLGDSAMAALIERESHANFQSGETEEATLDKAPLEYSGSGMGDLRPAAISVLSESGDNIIDLRYQSYEILKGKPAIVNLPHTYADSSSADTLVVTLKDTVQNITVDLYYTAFANLSVITRWAVIKNEGSSKVAITKAMSASLNLPSIDMDFLHLHGAWGREFNLEKMPISHCTQSISSFKGASGHQHNPFAAFATKGCSETSGEVYGVSLVYSGNFLIESDVDSNDTLRVNAGINDRAFKWNLTGGESFSCPEAVLVYSDSGLGGMSRTYHDLYRKHLCRGVWRDRPRPVLINTWEAVYFDFDRECLMSVAKSAAQLGVELYVLDDGWFGKRNDDTCSLGDWYVNEDKLGCSLNTLVEDIKKLGMKFGLWVEPEMICPVSDLYRAHPDWCLCQPHRKASLSRNQLILDLSRKDVRDYIIERMTAIFSSADISYVKWDMNRNMQEIGSAQLAPECLGELPHRYMLGLYEILETITQRFPNILFESCSSGGGRFDPGMLYYMPQVWTSDDTDAIQRLTIQSGASLVYPPAVMGCHVSAAPNHQVGRTTPIATRYAAAMQGGAFGYEMDLGKLSEEEKGAVREQIAEYKKYRELNLNGDLYRLKSPVDSKDCAFMTVSKEKTLAIVSYFKILNDTNFHVPVLKLQGLDETANYRDVKSNLVYSGAVLMKVGLKLPPMHEDFASIRMILKKI